MRVASEPDAMETAAGLQMLKGRLEYFYALGAGGRRGEMPGQMNIMKRFQRFPMAHPTPDQIYR
jgi:hypothetical protein